MNLRETVATFRGHREPHFRLMQHRRWWFVISGVAIVVSLLGLFVRELNLSIDFEGGSQLTYANTTAVEVDDIRQVLEREPWKLEGSEIQILGGDQVSVRAPSLTTLDDTERTQLIDALAEQAGVSPDEVNRTDVGPTWGSEISRKALQGLVIVLIAIAAYISFRFEWKMALGAQVALAHDVIITAGVYALVGREVTPATIIAILTIMGFSLYDTVVIYDKIKENTESPVVLARDTYTGVVNTSLNQVFMRSVNTSLVVVFPIASLLLFGGETLKDFAFAMLIGVITGAYSSIFVAAPILTLLKEREPRYAQLRTRAGREPGRQPGPAAPERRDVDEPVSGSAVPSAVGAAAATRGTARAGQPSRPRSRRKPPAKRRRR